MKDWPTLKNEMMERASFCTPPMHKDVDTSLHIHLITSMNDGHFFLLSAQGHGLWLDFHRALSYDIHLSPSLSPEQISNIHSIAFNANGTKILCSGTHALYVLEVDYDARTQRLVPDAFSATRYSWKGMDHHLHLLTDASLNTLEKAKAWISSNGQTVKCITQEIYTVSVKSLGYFNEKEAPAVRDVAWHPLSVHHVVVLSSTESVLLFDTSAKDLSEAEQSHPVKASTNTMATSFSFGSNRGWERFTIYILLGSGDVYALCPVVPHGLKVHCDGIEELLQIVKCETMHVRNTKSDSPERHFQLGLFQAQQYWLEQVWKADTKTLLKTGSEPASARKKRFAAPDEDSDEEEVEGKKEVMVDLYKTVYFIFRPHNLLSSWPVLLQGPMKVSPKSSASPDKDMTAVGILGVSSSPNQPAIGSRPLLAVIYNMGLLEILSLPRPIAPKWHSKDDFKCTPTALLVDAMQLGIDVHGGKPKLMLDPAVAHYFYCCHSTGIHLVNVNAYANKAAIAEKPGQCSVRRLFSVSPQREKTLDAIIGAAILHQAQMGHILVLRMATGAFETIQINENQVPQIKARVKASNQEQPIDGWVPFSDILEEEIQCREPGIVKVSGSTALEEVDDATVEFLITNMESMQNSEVRFINGLHDKIQERKQTHQKLFKDQQLALDSNLDKMKMEAKETEKLIVQLKKILKVQENLQKRSAFALQCIQEEQPCVSTAEKRYRTELDRLRSASFRVQPQVAEAKLKVNRLIAYHEEHSKVVQPLPEPELSHDQQNTCHDVLLAQKSLLRKSQTILDSVTTQLSHLDM